MGVLDSADGVPGGRLGRAVHRLAPWLLGLTVLVGIAASPRHPPHPLGGAAGLRLPGPAAAALVLASAVAAGTARRRRWPLYLAAPAGWLTLSAWLPVAAAGYYTVVSEPPGRRRTLRVTVFASVAAAGVAVPLSAGLPGARRSGAGLFEGGLFGAGVAALLVGLPITAGLWVDARRRAVVALRERAERLRREQEARAEQARAEERVRIAREMHDVVAHRLALMVLQAGALEMTAPDPPTVETAAVIRTAGRAALAELRQVLGLLRPDGAAPPSPSPTLADLDRLVGQTRAAGIPVEYRDEGGPPAGAEPAALPAAVQRAAYRVVQEALTNVAKHAGGAATTVVVRYLPELLEVEVRNAAPVAPADDRDREREPGGFGLIGLAERVGVLGGSVTAAATPDGGFAVHARLPVGTTAGPPGDVAT